MYATNAYGHKQLSFQYIYIHVLYKLHACINTNSKANSKLDLTFTGALVLSFLLFFDSFPNAKKD